MSFLLGNDRTFYFSIEKKIRHLYVIIVAIVAWTALVYLSLAHSLIRLAHSGIARSRRSMRISRKKRVFYTTNNENGDSAKKTTYTHGNIQWRQFFVVFNRFQVFAIYLCFYSLNKMLLFNQLHNVYRSRNNNSNKNSNEKTPLAISWDSDLKRSWIFNHCANVCILCIYLCVCMRVCIFVAFMNEWIHLTIVSLFCFSLFQIQPSHSFLQVLLTLLHLNTC